MHKIDIDSVEMTLDVMKYALNRITHTSPKLGVPMSPADLQERVGETITPDGIGGERAFELFRNHLVSSTIPIDHPRHLAFVPASPSRASIMFDLVTSASSIHGAYWMEGSGGIYAENEAMKWLVSLTGLPDGAFGVFTSGGTAANLSALVAARETWRDHHPSHQEQKGLMITSTGAHSSVKAMAKVIDTEVILVKSEEQLTGAQLEATISSLSDAQRDRLFAVVATGGTTNAGIIDDLSGIAAICESQQIWMHVDAAYGGAALAAPSVRHQFEGIESADSITIDPHKWLFSPYDCGAVIYKNPALAKKAHQQEGSYLEVFKDIGADGFNPTDYQIQLTRRVRGLPLWFSLAMHGTDKYVEAVERGITLARMAGDVITRNDHVELVRPPSLSCVLYRRIGWNADDYLNWTLRNLRSGYALVTPTLWGPEGAKETIARFCFINPDTTEEDIVGIIDTMQ
ncbi:MAG: aminotransferase class V-fold PLP-dependent enzyme [Bacteroidota bacterium]